MAPSVAGSPFFSLIRTRFPTVAEEQYIIAIHVFAGLDVKIGIDFGTTNSTVCEFGSDGKPRIQGPVPSVGIWSNGSFLFGDDALQQLKSPRTDLHPVRDLKLSLRKGEILNFGGTQVPTQTAAAQLLGYLCRLIGVDSVSDIDEVVIGTPVLMAAEHREALVAAAVEAGLDSCRLVYEPTSALVGAEVQDQIPGSGLVLVVDWGGGTLDLSVVSIENGVFREVAVRGESKSMGGSDMDREIVKRLLADEPELRTGVSAVPNGEDRLAAEIEIEKINFLEEYDPGDDTLIAPEWLDEIIELRRDLVFEVVDRFTGDAIGEIEKMLLESSIPEDRLGHVIFAGGTCKADRVSSRIMKRFGGLSQIPVIAPQQLTGIGCARLAANGFILQLAADFGVRQVDDSICVLLEEGTDLDAGSYRTAEFLVTDPTSVDAYVELGILRGGGTGAALERKADTFLPLKNFSIATGRTQSQQSNPALEYVLVSAGVSDDLTVNVYAQTSVAGASKAEKVSGVPVALHVKT